jgi:hypothetical protein
MIARNIRANVTKLIKVRKMHMGSKRENPQSPVGLGKGAVYRVPTLLLHKAQFQLNHLINHPHPTPPNQLLNLIDKQPVRRQPPTR